MKVKKASVTRVMRVRRRVEAVKMERKAERQVTLLSQGAKKLDFRMSAGKPVEGFIEERLGLVNVC